MRSVRGPRRGLGLGLLLRGLRVVLVRALGRRLLGLPLALGRPVVRVVEAGALEVDGDGVEDALYRRLARLAGGHGVVRDPLHHLEQVPVLAAVLVDRHRGGGGYWGPSARSRGSLSPPPT